METLDLAPGGAVLHRPEAERRVVLLPGIVYSTQAPLLWFAREAALARGWGALEVQGVPGSEDDPLAWTAQRAATTAPTLLVGGTADPTWVPDAVPDAAPLARLELDGLDHSLQRAGDVTAGLDALAAVTRAVDAFLDAAKRKGV